MVRLYRTGLQSSFSGNTSSPFSSGIRFSFFWTLSPGRLSCPLLNPGRCPGLYHNAPSGRFLSILRCLRYQTITSCGIIYHRSFFFTTRCNRSVAGESFLTWLQISPVTLKILPDTLQISLVTLQVSPVTFQIWPDTLNISLATF